MSSAAHATRCSTSSASAVRGASSLPVPWACKVDRTQSTAPAAALQRCRASSWDNAPWGSCPHRDRNASAWTSRSCIHAVVAARKGSRASGVHAVREREAALVPGMGADGGELVEADVHWCRWCTPCARDGGEAATHQEGVGAIAVPTGPGTRGQELPTVPSNLVTSVLAVGATWATWQLLLASARSPRAAVRSAAPN